MERWMNGMNNLRNATGDTTPNDYQSDAYVYQLGRNGNGFSTRRESLR